MQGSARHHDAREQVQGLPGDRLTHPSGPDREVFAVRDMVSLQLTEVTGTDVSSSGEQLQQTARDTAAVLEHTSRGRPFTPHLDVWKVRGKVFLIVTDDDPDLRIVTVKVDPQHGDALRRDHPSITRGRYLDKRHWTSIGAGRGIGPRLVDDLVRGSYELVSGSVPADPADARCSLADPVDHPDSTRTSR